MVGPLALAHALVLAWNAHDSIAVAALHAAEFEGYDVADPVVYRGPDGARRAMESRLAAFPDLQVTLEQVLVDGERLALVWLARGTHLGSILRIPPTGRLVSSRGICVLSIRGERISRATNVWDVAGLLRDLGLLPDLAP